MKKEIEFAVDEYQCTGCVQGPTLQCYSKNYYGVGCKNHCAGTHLTYIGKIFLGLPKGFNRIGNFTEKMYVQIYEKFEDRGNYDKFNVPVWKHVNEYGHTIVRGLRPRLNDSFIEIFLENCEEEIDCILITKEEIKEMD